jgi:pyrimidine-nucleoside phosphorylase
MISGRGLGFTGGTLDKLESIPGFNTKPTIKEFERIVSEVGLAIIGQTDNIVPADKKIYALRDVTATVESNPLICSSILSKKFAEDIDALVMDLKVGRGAFMKDIKEGLLLAKNIIGISHAFGKKASCILTNMNAPLGFAVGNWLEIAETVHCLNGLDVPDVMEVTHYLAGAMLTMAEVTKNINEGVEFSKKAISSGAAYNKFLDMVSAQGGDISYIENLEKYRIAKYAISVKSDNSGYVSSIDALKIGILGIDIGIGRLKTDDVIDFSSGIVFKKKIGDSVDIGDELAICYTERQNILKYASSQILESYSIVQDDPFKDKKDSLIISIIGDINPE